MIDDIRTAQRMIERNQLRAMLDEEAERRVWLAHEINTRQNIVTVEAIADNQSDGIKASMPCDCRAAGVRGTRCGSCGR